MMLERGLILALAGALCFSAACQTAASSEQPPNPALEGSSGGTATASSTARFVAPALGPAPSISVALSASSTASASASPIGLATSSASAAPAEPEPCPSDMVLVGRFCVDRYEAHLAVESSDGRLVKHPYYERPAAGVKYVAVNEAGQFPQGYISRVESKAACEAAGKRLCTRGEWMRACRGKGWMVYPYAARGERGRCNSGKDHLLTQLFKIPKGQFKYDEHFNSPELNKTPGFLARSGELERCSTELGLFDMVGNLHEWVSDNVDESFVEMMEKEDVERRDQPWNTGNGVFMGGFYSTLDQHGPGCLFTTIAHEPAYHDYSTGFRCCKKADLPKVDNKKKPPAGTGQKTK